MSEGRRDEKGSCCAGQTGPGAAFMTAAKALMVAAPKSGSGKTTVTLALALALRRRGVRVRIAKNGPDYIDPAFHAEAVGLPCFNLDSWAMPPVALDAIWTELAVETDLILIEASMGLFDGGGSQPGRMGAASDLAARFGVPVLLVLDVSGQSQSAAAVARGFATHDPAVRLAGVIANNLASDRHAGGVAHAMKRAGLPLLGTVRRGAVPSLPERHLGLVQAREHGTLPALFEALANVAEASFDLDAILSAAVPVVLPPREDSAPLLPPPGQRIALAWDDAFSFAYPHMLAGWRREGAEIVCFSPLADQPPSEDCDAVWLPGGYPELHAARLAAASSFRSGMLRAAEQGAVHGECGGYMALGAGLEDAEGVIHPMLSLLSHVTSFRQRRLNLGYRQAILEDTSVLGPQGAVLRGHEFHYARVIDPGSDAPLARLSDAEGRVLGLAGGIRGRVSGSFFHVLAREAA
ncbi:Cobyrinic acid a,c-diamide synthase [Granulibacter bethesdensis]|nr:Cobyrinic acid a,c-diamide synthase [Granulibacter bethesdensis]